VAEYYPESPHLEDYLACTTVIDVDHPTVVATACELTAGCAGDAAIAQRLYEFVRDEIPHTNDVGGQLVTCRASEVLAMRTGICYAKSHLLAALLRAVDVPTGFVYQRLRKDLPSIGFELHALNGAYLASLGRWVRFDARGNKPGVEAQFDVEHERLAFPVDETRGECTYRAIFAEPAVCVVAALQSHATLAQLWANLPGDLNPRG
jgi:transglutaminase-like putative cysteine protease